MHEESRNNPISSEQRNTSQVGPEAGTTTHAKIVAVDSTYVFIGSHNWTESVLTANNEVSVIIVSEEIA